jgi:hypothetical protein
MTPRTFTGLAIVTVAFAAAAAYGVVARYGTSGPQTAETLMFPGLADKINSVTELSVQSADKTVVVKKTDTGWVIANTYNYPAVDASVREALIGVSRLTLVDPKTKMPDRFSRLEVEDVGKDAHSRLWQLKDAGGNVLADVIMGKRRYDLGGAEENGIYVRKPGTTQAWLARAKLPDDKDSMAWIDRKIVDVRKRRIEKITTIDANGATLTVSRQDPDAEDYVVDNLPPGFKLKDRYQWDVNGMGLTLTGMQFDAVMPLADLHKDFTAPPVEKAEVETHDGLILHIAMLKSSDDSSAPWWVVVSADTDPNVKATPSGEGPDHIGTPEEVQKEAAAINAKTKGWAYQLSESQTRSLRVRLADLQAPASGS